MRMRRLLIDSDTFYAERYSDLQYFRDRYTVASAPTIENSGDGKVMVLDGTDDKVTVGNLIETAKTVIIRAYLTSTTEQLLDFDGGTNYLDATAGTLAVATCADEVLYVDGSATATVTAGWRSIAFTTATGIAVTNLQVATDATSFGQIKVAYVILSKRVWSSTEILAIHEGKLF